MIFTCRIGRLTFSEGTDLVLAKRVRDNLLGQILNPEPGSVRIRTETNCYDYIRNECGNLLAAIKFEIELRDPAVV